jgi:hypothetical protein
MLQTCPRSLTRGCIVARYYMTQIYIQGGPNNRNHILPPPWDSNRMYQWMANPFRRKMIPGSPDSVQYIHVVLVVEPFSWRILLEEKWYLTANRCRGHGSHTRFPKSKKETCTRRSTPARRDHVSEMISQTWARRHELYIHQNTTIAPFCRG